jgi:hypothetical protein
MSGNIPLEQEIVALSAGRSKEWLMPDTTNQPVEVVREVRDLSQQLVDPLVRNGEAGA